MEHEHNDDFPYEDWTIADLAAAAWDSEAALEELNHRLGEQADEDADEPDELDGL